MIHLIFNDGDGYYDESICTTFFTNIKKEVGKKIYDRSNKDELFMIPISKYNFEESFNQCIYVVNGSIVKLIESDTDKFLGCKIPIRQSIETIGKYFVKCGDIDMVKFLYEKYNIYDPDSLTTSLKHNQFIMYNYVKNNNIGNQISNQEAIRLMLYHPTDIYFDHIMELFKIEMTNHQEKSIRKILDNTPIPSDNKKEIIIKVYKKMYKQLLKKKKNKKICCSEYIENTDKLYNDMYGGDCEKLTKVLMNFSPKIITNIFSNKKSFHRLYSMSKYNELCIYITIVELLETELKKYNTENTIKKCYDEIRKYDGDHIYQVALKYENGNKQCNIQIDKEKAIVLYKFAIEKGNTDSMNMLACVYKNNDINKAIELYQLATDNGHDDAAYNLATIYYNGINVPIDKYKAIELYKKAIALGHRQSIYQLALIYDNDNDIYVNKHEAAQLYQKASIKGDNNAKFKLALMYDNGNGINVDKMKAFTLYKQLANVGNVGAILKVAEIYDKGEIVPVNKENAKKFYRMANNRKNKCKCGKNVRYDLFLKNDIKCAKCNNIKFKNGLKLNLCSTQCNSTNWSVSNYFTEKTDKNKRIEFKSNNDKCENCGNFDCDTGLFVNEL